MIFHLLFNQAKPPQHNTTQENLSHEQHSLARIDVCVGSRCGYVPVPVPVPGPEPEPEPELAQKPAVAAAVHYTCPCAQATMQL